MLFNSYQFIIVFLPLTLLGYYLLGAYQQWRLGWLLLTSAVFYAYWDVRFLPMLLGSVLLNWLLSQHLRRANLRLLVVLGLIVNLLLIGIFKYLNFFAGTFYSLTNQPFTAYDLVLPLGISFFTFQQISYLVDRARGNAEPYPLLEYTLYVIFFPQLIAGPIVRHNEIIPQYKKSPLRQDVYHHIGVGTFLFCLGLTKKTLIADRLAQTASPLFETAANGEALTLVQGWLASASYSLQLYFDFSGYSDMAIGLGLLFGFSLPINFNAPYRALSINDFWRRWHLTLSRFLRDYLYIPLGGNRHGLGRFYGALLITMLLGGLWHGAGWTFVAWGGLHGCALIINHAWMARGLVMPASISWPVTLVFVMFGWVIFRADSIDSATVILSSMLGAQGFNFDIDDTSGGLFCLFGFILAIVGPTSQVLAYKYLKPTVPYAAAIAGLLVYLTLNIVSDGYSEFLYFQF